MHMRQRFGATVGRSVGLIALALALAWPVRANAGEILTLNGFVQVPGLLTSISVGAEQSVWGLNGSNIYLFNSWK